MGSWFLENWSSLLSASGVLTAAGGLVKFGPRIGRRIVLMLDCEVDRVRWEEADRLRNRELKLLRQDVTNLQDDVGRLLARLAVSGAGSGTATAAEASMPTNKPTPSAT